MGKKQNTKFVCSMCGNVAWSADTLRLANRGWRFVVDEKTRNYFCTCTEGCWHQFASAQPPGLLQPLGAPPPIHDNIEAIKPETKEPLSDGN